MIESYTSKVFFVDDAFKAELKDSSINDFNAFYKVPLDTQIIKLPLSKEDLHKVVEYIPASEIRAGNVVAKTGYRSQFGPIDEFLEDHTVRKFGLWVRLCVALGAKNVKVNNIEKLQRSSNTKSDTGFAAEVEAPLGGGKAEFNRSVTGVDEELRAKILDISASAHGGEPDWEAADDLIQRYGLKHEDIFVNLYEMRKVKTNKLTSHQFTLDVTQDVKRMFDASTKAKLEVAAKIYKGNLGFDMNRLNNEVASSTIKISVTVEF